jgi:hypothetical protein
MFFLTCHPVSIQSQGVCWYPSVDKRGKTMLDRHQRVNPADHEQLQL